MAEWLKVKNNAKSVLDANLTDSATTCKVKHPANFLNEGTFPCTIWEEGYNSPAQAPAFEIVYVTAVSGSNFTIERARVS